jgi:hypothetical protein
VSSAVNNAKTGVRRPFVHGMMGAMPGMHEFSLYTTNRSPRKVLEYAAEFCTALSMLAFSHRAWAPGYGLLSP